MIMNRDKKKYRIMTMLLSIVSVLVFMATCTSDKYGSGDDMVNKEISDDDQELIKRANSFFGPLPLPDTTGAEFSAIKVQLGRMLFYDARLSKSSFISCNSCHSLATFGVDNLPTSVGHNWQLGGRNAPSVINAALHTTQFWDGRAADVEEQATMPILNPIEMAIPHEEISTDRITSIKEYVELFSQAFPGEENPITLTNIGNAIGAFERMLITPSRFDDYMNGDPEALNEQEKRGLVAFLAANCQTCHMTPLLGGHIYQKFGVMQDYWELTGSEIPDLGRGEVTKDPNQNYFFKVPGLRNIDRTYPYFHDGSIWSLRDAVSIMNELQFGKKLGDQELDDIVAFLGSLTGELPESARVVPILPPSSATTSRPDLN